ncbi:hypothetical protein QWA_18135 [Alcaligenes faecalis subsp. faecalis NCIB 8687]|nr:hypothetical protein QWA_18135 [Alcaligenes faecalis subsp. faecalis NCIB 8687]
MQGQFNLILVNAQFRIEVKPIILLWSFMWPRRLQNCGVFPSRRWKKPAQRIFSERIKDWDTHLGVMEEFWSSLLLKTDGFNGNPMAKHLSLQHPGQHGLLSTN